MTRAFYSVTLSAMLQQERWSLYKTVRDNPAYYGSPRRGTIELPIYL